MYHSIFILHVAEEKKYHIKLTRAACPKKEPVPLKSMQVKTELKCDDISFKSVSLEIRSTGRQMYGGTKDFPFHPVSDLEDFKS